MGIKYYNRDFEKQLKTFGGYTARVIQHEYDHTEGKLYIDHINPLTRRLIGGKLKKIVKGNIRPKYEMTFRK
ncbi:MAG: peptide deformylase [Mangrovibacterium sp.]